MSTLILLRRLRVENANAVAGLTWGFPAMTHFMGYTHALSRRLGADSGLSLTACAVICHDHQAHAYSSGRDYQFALTRNPLTKEGKTASFNEEGRMHMTVSLLLECQGEIENGEYGRRDLEVRLAQLCPSQRLAGGIITGEPEILVLDRPRTTGELKKLQWRMMPGFVLRDRSNWLGEHHQALLQEDPQATRLDAWLDFAALKMQAEMPEGEEPQEGAAAAWRYLPKPRPGYLVPLMTGWQRISALYPPGAVENVRDPDVPFAFAEAVYGIGEWCGVHRISDLNDVFWRYHTTETGYYCCGTDVQQRSEHHE
jgi:CRISPR-associated protein Csy2